MGFTVVAALGSEAATRKHLPARNSCGLSDSSPQLWPEPDFRHQPKKASKSSLDFKRYVTDRRLAETLAQIYLGKPNRPPHLLLECNPGPGILTQALLEAGAKVVALESDKTFIPHLESLGKNLDGKLRVIHCDFFKIDPRSGGVIKPPAMSSRGLFKNLGIEAVPWTADIPLKVVGMFPSRDEKRALWKLAYDLYSCTSIYKFGRIEVNMFIGEKEFQKLMADPRNPELYHVLSVIWQVACEIKVLHMEPSSSFVVYTRKGPLENPKRRELLDLLQQKLYLIQMTPRQNLFTKNLTPMNYNIFFHLLKHCFGRRSATVVDHLRSLTPLDARDILMQIGKQEDQKVVNMYPQDFKTLFETIECSKNCAYRWLYDETLEDR
ncbi:dimethyladenosine transferase 2, mitochondrial isoform X2 [Pongo pygmaeus]|uniref:dimethyladenosine transferase 2, mitochondrial isoform X2 n=1 Tax=Pongo pygmaeus TaxID=9600 RepID=UPI000CEFD342|nr:dimethyladenosine transferase 2, mitochondrial isoform X2 [Pongo pygmaeus]